MTSPDVTRLSHLLERTAIPFRVVDPDQDRDASSLLARFAPNPEDLPVAVLVLEALAFGGQAGASAASANITVISETEIVELVNP